MLDTFDKVAKLAQAPILKHVPLEHLYELAERVCYKDDFRKGDELFSPDKPIDFLFVLVSGQVNVVRQGEGTIDIIQTLSAIDTLGEMGVFQSEATGIGAIAASDAVSCLLIPRSELEELLELQPTLTQHIIRRLTGRLVRAYEELSRHAKLTKRLQEREEILDRRLVELDRIPDIDTKLDRLLGARPQLHTNLNPQQPKEKSYTDDGNSLA